MISAKSIERLYQSSKPSKLRAARKLYSLHTNLDSVEDTTMDTHLSRDQVLEIYDWIAQLNAQ